MADTSGVASERAATGQSDWRTAWMHSPAGRLRHSSGLTFNVIRNGIGHAQARVDLASLEVWETFELQGGLGLIELPRRRQRLVWEAAEWLATDGASE